MPHDSSKQRSKSQRKNENRRAKEKALKKLEEDQKKLDYLRQLQAEIMEIDPVNGAKMCLLGD